MLIDLQYGVLPNVGGPYSTCQGMSSAAQPAARIRTLGAPVVLVQYTGEILAALEQ